jgi:hypothetical protein
MGHTGNMTRIEKLEREVQALSQEELAQFRDWFVEYDWAMWDCQIERDSADGKLDGLVAQARRDHDAGRSTDL